MNRVHWPIVIGVAVGCYLIIVARLHPEFLAPLGVPVAAPAPKRPPAPSVDDPAVREQVLRTLRQRGIDLPPGSKAVLTDPKTGKQITLTPGTEPAPANAPAPGNAPPGNAPAPGK